MSAQGVIYLIGGTKLTEIGKDISPEMVNRIMLMTGQKVVILDNLVVFRRKDLKLDQKIAREPVPAKALKPIIKSVMKQPARSYGPGSPSKKHRGGRRVRR